MKTNLYYIICITALLFLAGCRQESPLPTEDEGMVALNYTVSLEQLEGRGLGDGSEVDQLVVGIFRDGSLVTKLTFADEADGTKDGKFQNIAIPMMRTEIYDLAFWAQTKENGIYTISDNFDIEINYDAYGHTLQNVENYDAFAGKQEGVSVANPGAKNVKLYRPFAQLNVGLKNASDVKEVTMTVTSVPTAYNLLSGSSGELGEVNLKFTDFSGMENDKLQTEEGDYTYLASAYLLPVASAQVEVKMDSKISSSVNIWSFDALPLSANRRTNLVGK